MNSTEYRDVIARLGLSQGGAARLVGVDARTSRRWALGEVVIPGPVVRLLWACAQFPAVLEALRDWSAPDSAAESTGQGRGAP